MMLSYISVPLMGFTSVAVMGHLEHPRYLAGVGLAANFFTYFYFVFAFIRWSTSGLAAQAKGRLVTFGGDNDLAVILARSMALGVGIGALLLVFSMPFSHVLFDALTADKAAGAEAALYAQQRLIGAPALLGTFALTGWFIGTRQPKAVMMMTIGGNVTNILLLLLFVEHWGLQSGGAGLATALAEWTGLLLGAAAVWRGSALNGGTFKLADVLDRAAWRQLFSANANVLFKTLSTIAIFMGFLAVSGQFPPNVLAANLILMQMFSLASYAFDGFANACETIAGQAEGAGQPELVRKALVKCCQCALWVGALFALAYGLGGPAVISGLTDLDSVKEAAMRYRYWMVLVPLACAGAIVYEGMFVGTLRLRDLRNCAIAATIGAIAVAAPAIWLLGNHGLWLALVSYFVIRQACGWWVFARPVVRDEAVPRSAG
jgi:MATE family multidrug resistance protein